MRLCFDKCSLTCIVAVDYVLHQASSESWDVHKPVYLGIFSYIQQYPGIFTHYSCIFRHVQIYSKPSVTVPYSESWHNQNPRHVQNPIQHVRWSILWKQSKGIIIFTHPSILENGLSSKYWSIFQSAVILLSKVERSKKFMT